MCLYGYNTHHRIFKTLLESSAYQLDHGFSTQTSCLLQIFPVYEVHHLHFKKVSRDLKDISQDHPANVQQGRIYKWVF